MTALHDITNQRFGNLVVIRRGPNQPRPDGKSHRTTWTCICDCGRTSDVAAHKLRSGRTRTCGHAQAFNDLSGKTFGQLTVRDEQWRRTKHGPEWFCDCSCNRESGWHRADHLLAGAVKRCEWCKRQVTRAARLIDLTGKTFGKLTVVRRASEHWGQKQVYWTCTCACGNSKTVDIDGARLKSGGTRSCGCIASGWDSPQRFIDEPEHAQALTHLYFVEVRGCLHKFGLAVDLFRRSRNAGEGNDYTKLYFQQQLPRAEAWAVEQSCLARTRAFWQPAKIRSLGMGGWNGWTELRYGLDLDESLKMIAELMKEVKEIGWYNLLQKHAPQTLANQQTVAA